MVNPANKVSFQKGVVDGVRPLKFSLSEFGISTGILGLYLYLTFRIFQGAFQKNEFHYEFNPDPEKVAGTVPSNYFTRCASGKSHEMEFSKGSNMKAPLGF